MNTFIKLTGIAIFATMLAADAAAATTGSCQSKAAKFSLGSTVSGRLVEEYDPEWQETTGSAVYYYKMTVKNGDSATLLMSGDSTTFDVYEDGDYEGESESAPPDWEDASDPYTAETRLILRAEDWSDDMPGSVTYYIAISGEDVDDPFTLKSMYGEDEPPQRKGIDVDSAVSVNPSTTFSSVVGTLTEAYGPGYYFKANLTAGLKYYFGTYDTTTNGTDITIDGFDDRSIVPTMTRITGKVDGTQIAGGTHTAYCVIPSETATYLIYVSTDSLDNSTTVTLHHKVLPSRKIKDHELAAVLGTLGETPTSAEITPVYRNNPESGVFDGTIDDALVSATLKKGTHYLFYVDKLSADPGNLLMELYDANGNVLLSSTKGFFGENEIGPMFVYEVPADGTYYVGVCQDTADSMGNEDPADLGLTGRISASKVTSDVFLDEYDLTVTDPNTEVTPIIPVIGEHGDAPEAVDVEGQVHNFGLTDWTDTFTFSVRKGITYSFRLKPETGTFTNGAEEVVVSGAGFAYVGKIYTSSGKKESVLAEVSDLSATNLSFKATRTMTCYLKITKNGQGVPAVYSLHSMASAPEGLGYLTVNIHGPTAEAAWYLKGDSSAFNYKSGTTLLLPATNITVQFLAVKGFSTAASVTGTVVKNDTTTFDAYYNDTFDPLDDNPDAKQKHPTLNKAYAPTKLTPNTKGVTAMRSLWKVDTEDWFTFSATAGTFYKFSLSDIEGDPEVHVYGPNNWTDECDYVIATNVAEAVQINAEKGTYYVKVTHADGLAQADSAYTLKALSAVPGLVKLAKTDVSVKDSAGYVDLSVSRTGKDGLVRVKYRTVGLQTGKDDAYYYPTNGVLTWAENDNKAQTIRVKLVPNAGWATNKIFKVVLEPFDVADLAAAEYPAVFVKDTKTGVPLDTARVTVTASAKKAPGTIQAANSDTPKKPVYAVKAGETIDIPFIRVSGADGIVGVKVETVKGTANKSGETDFTPVTTNFVWAEGETATQTISVATKTLAGDYTATKTFTLKLTALTSKKGDAMQYDRPTLAASAVTVNIANEKFADTMANFAKVNATALKAKGIAVKEGKAGTWFIDSDGSVFTATAGASLTFTLTGPGRFVYSEDGVEKTVEVAKTEKVTVTGKLDYYRYDPPTGAETLLQGVKYVYGGVLSGDKLKVASGKLPDGIALSQNKTTKAWSLSGVPKKAGYFAATLSTGEALAYDVRAAGTSIGTFNGLVTTTDTTNEVPKLAKVEVTAKSDGKLTAKVTIGGKSYSFADTGYVGVTGDLDDDAPDFVKAELFAIQKVGSGKNAQTLTNWLYYTVMNVAETAAVGWYAEGDVEIQMAALPDAKGNGYQEDVTYTGKICRDSAKITDKTALAAWQSTAAKYAGYYTVSLVAPGAMAGEPCGSGYMTLTLDAKGKAKVAGKLADGTAYTSSATAAFVGAADSPSIRVPLYAYKGTGVFGGWLSIRANDAGDVVAEIDSPDTDIVWKNDDPNATREGEEGFALDLQPVGGWYDTVSNLQRFYLESDLSVDIPDRENALEDIMEALDLGGDYLFVAQPSGQAVDLVGNTLSVVKQTLAKDASKKLTDWDASVNASNVKLTFKRATGIVSGTFDLWYEGTNAKGAVEQKSIKGLKHEGVVTLLRGDDGVLEPDVLSAGFFVAPQKIKYIDARGATKTRTWNGSYRFDIKAVDAARDWTDADPE